MTISNRSMLRTRASSKRPRRGVALVFVLVFVIAMAALAMSSIFMASNANLLAKSYDRERDLKFAAEAALALGKSRVNQDPNALLLSTGSIMDTLLQNYTITGADGQPIGGGIKVNVYVGPTGSTSGQFGRFSSIVAEARDPRQNGFIRRLELTQESFAKFAYWSNSESNGSTTIFFNNGDALWGPVWSNDTISIGTGGASFHDEVGTVFQVDGAGYGTFSKGKKEHQRPIPLPSTSVLNNLGTIAATSGWDFASQRAASQDETSVKDRLEFVAVDINGLADSTDQNEGFFMVFKDSTDIAARGDYPTASVPPTAAQLKWCGDWHLTRQDSTQASSRKLQFYPASVHSNTWFELQMKQGLIDSGVVAGVAATRATNEKGASVDVIMSHANARCYLPGDPHLVAVERNTAIRDSSLAGNPFFPLGSVNKGGNDTTFSPHNKDGHWMKSPQTPSAGLLTKRPPWMASFMWPIHREFNPNAKGVIHFNGNVALSGTLNGRMTMYANGTIVLVDDLRYANDPVMGVCRDILGLISSKDIVIADNALLDPQRTNGSSGDYTNMDDTPDLYIHAVMMALGTSFRAQNYTGGPAAANNCGTTTNGRGCIYLSGGIIQNSRGPVGLSTGYGWAKRYSYDHCAVVTPPPYFPTTGRFQDNRYLELDPAGFNPANYFRSLTPDP